MEYEGVEYWQAGGGGETEDAVGGDQRDGKGLGSIIQKVMIQTHKRLK